MYIIGSTLIGFYYKILVKILFKRLRIVLPCIIDECQYTFLGGQNILDSVLTTNEVVDEVRSKKNATFIFKPDFEKTYDMVRWKFLYYLL